MGLKTAPVVNAMVKRSMSSSVIELSNYLEKRISQNSAEFEKSAASLDEVGNVISVGDGIARIYGLNKVQAG